MAVAEEKHGQHQFADSVASAGNVNGDEYDDIVIGSYDDGESSVSVFFGSAEGLNPDSDSDWFDVPLKQFDSQFGHSVASADVNGDEVDDVLVGAPFFNGGDPVKKDGGKAYVYFGSDFGPAQQFEWYADGNAVERHLGYVVASAGDVNGDGFDDIVVGAPDLDQSEVKVGIASVYHGAANQPLEAAVAEVELTGPDSRENFAWSVASAGDVNGDGFDDVMVGAPHHYFPYSIDEGGAWVYHGSADGLKAEAEWARGSGQADSEFGYSVASAGDVNDDGFDDVIVGAPRFGIGGGAFLYLGSSDGLLPDAERTFEPNDASAEYGTSVASSGDVNADDYADVVVGAPGTGRVYVYLGSADGLVGIEDWSVAWPDSRFGATVAAAGDVNGDSYGDLIVGAPNYEIIVGTTYGTVTSNYGAAFVYFGQQWTPSVGP